MHCILLNITKTLFGLWMGDKLPDAQEDIEAPYLLSKSSKTAISRAVKSARSNFPHSLGHAPRDPIARYRSFKASEWKSFLENWGPAVMAEHIGDLAYGNLLVLCRILHLASKFIITQDEITRLRQLCLTFVKGFERIYYRGNKDCLPVCTVNIHSLLHLADHIEDWGPASYWWQFPLERHLGALKKMARSKSQMDQSLSNSVVVASQLSLLGLFDPSIPEHSTVPEVGEKFKGRLRSKAWTRHHKKWFHEHIARNDPGIPRLATNEELETADSFSRFSRNGETFGSISSQRKTDINRDDSRICYWDQEGLSFAAVVCFLTTSSFGTFAFVQDLGTVEELATPDILTVQSVSASGKKQFIDLVDIVGPIGILTERDSRQPSRQTHVIIGSLHPSFERSDAWLDHTWELPS